MNKITQAIRSILVVTEKNVRIYYSKPPIIIFGLLFPFFLFLAFFLGRQLDLYNFFPGFMAMSVFFTSSSVGPLITPWEKAMGTYERLLSFPVTTSTLILGDTMAGMIFGLGLSTILAIVGIFTLNYSVNIIMLILGIIVSSFIFSSLGVFLASPSSKSPSNIMMLSSIVRFPLIFISGIFIPLNELPLAGRILSYFSPITYLVDIFNYSLKGTHNINIWIDFAALIGFCIIFLYLANIFHKRNLLKGL